MPTLTVTVGLPGCGKSTWASEQIKKSKTKTVNINRDDIRQSMMAGDLDSYSYKKNNERYVTDQQLHMALSAVVNDWNIIISDTNLKPAVVDMWKKFAKDNHYTYKEVNFFDEFVQKSSKKVPDNFFLYNDYVQQCKKWDLLRRKSVGSEIIDTMAESSYYANVVQLQRNLTLPEAIIVDIDGTLAHMHSRSPFDESRVHEDSPDMEVILSVIAEARFYNRKVIIMSGRHELCRVLTEEWLDRYNVPYDHLFMRADDDIRGDDIVKYELYVNNVLSNYNVVKVFDDRNKVVFMWRKLLGLKVFQVEYGNF